MWDFYAKAMPLFKGKPWKHDQTMEELNLRMNIIELFMVFVKRSGDGMLWIKTLVRMVRGFHRIFTNQRSYKWIPILKTMVLEVLTT